MCSWPWDGMEIRIVSGRFRLVGTSDGVPDFFFQTRESEIWISSLTSVNKDNIWKTIFRLWVSGNKSDPREMKNKKVNPMIVLDFGFECFQAPLQGEETQMAPGNCTTKGCGAERPNIKEEMEHQRWAPWEGSRLLMGHTWENCSDTQEKDLRGSGETVSSRHMKLGTVPSSHISTNQTGDPHNPKDAG